jgi:hypothetical protein
MKIHVLMKTGLIGLLLSVLAGCQSAPHGLTAAQIAVLKEQGFRLTDEGWTLDFSNRAVCQQRRCPDPQDPCGGGKTGQDPAGGWLEPGADRWSYRLQRGGGL